MFSLVKNWIHANNFALIIFTLLFLTIVGYFYRGLALSYPFVDEQDNFAIGKYLLKGEVLYDDIVTNHQPFAYILSALVQQAKDSNTTFSLLVNQRTGVIIWSAFWSIIFVIFFGPSGFLFVLIFELTKIYLFGNLFLAEAIAVYPLLFAIGVLIFGKKTNFLTYFFLGISMVLSGLTLITLWPVLALLMFLTFKSHHQPKKLIFFLLGILIVISFILEYTSPTGFIHYLYVNFIYTIPQFHNDYQESWLMTLIKAFSTPVFSFTIKNANPILWEIRILTLILVVNIIYLVFKKKFIFALGVITLLGLSNIRFIYPGDTFYSGFHLLPWYSVLVFLTMAISVEQFKSSQNHVLRMINIVLILIAISISFKYAQETLFIKKDWQKEYTTNYSTHTDIGQVIKIMKSPQDSLFVSPNAWTVYWQSDVFHLPKLYGYYAWMSGIPEFHNQIISRFSKDPPTFFFCEDCGGLDLGKFLYQYKEVIKNDGKTNLFVLQSRIDNLTKAQWEQLKFYGID